MISLEHIHPMVVHFPIALILAGYMTEFIYLFFKKLPILKEFHFWLLAAGSLSAFAAYFSGAFITPSVPPEATAVFSRHEFFAELTVFTTLVNTALLLYLKLEKKDETRLKWLAFIMNTLTVILLFITGHYGGILVYNYLIK